MHDLSTLIALTGSVLCLGTRLPGSARCWVPHGIALGVMLLMTVGGSAPVLLAGAAAVAVACGVVALAGSRPGRAAAVVDLAAMSLLTAVFALTGRAGAVGFPAGESMTMPIPMPTMSMADHSGWAGPGFALLLIACWALARAVVRLGPLLGRPPARTDRRQRRGLWSAISGEAGSLAMVVGMAAMLR